MLELCLKAITAFLATGSGYTKLKQCVKESKFKSLDAARNRIGVGVGLGAGTEAGPGVARPSGRAASVDLKLTVSILAAQLGGLGLVHVYKYLCEACPSNLLYLSSLSTS